MNRTIGGIPVLYWLVGLGTVVGASFWLKRRQAAGTTATASKTPAFTQEQEVQDFQIFSALTGQQQASDLNFLGTVAGLFGGGGSGTSSTTGSGGSSGSSGGGGTSTTPSTVAPAPAATGTAPPTTTPASSGPVLPEISATQPYPSNYIFANPSNLNVSNPTVRPTSQGGTSYNPPAPALPAGETSGEYYSIPGDPY